MFSLAGLLAPACAAAAQDTTAVNDHKSRGIYYQRQGKLARAIVEYRKALQDNPDDAASHNNIALAFMKMDLLHDAEAELHGAIDLKPNKPDYHYNLAIVLMKQSNLNPAEKEFRKAIELKADDPEAHFRLAQVFMLEGKTDDARTAIDRTVELQPSNNSCERAIKAWVLVRKNALFVGSDAGGKAAAIHMSFISSCNRLGIDPLGYLTDVYTRINSMKTSELKQLLPDRWAQERASKPPP